MTVAEMLDLLESRIASLGAERARLASALEQAERRLEEIAGTAPAKTARRKPAKKSRKRTASATPAKAKAARKAAPKAATIEAAPPPAPETPPAPRGKRVALGRGLAQLRARSTQDPPQPADING